MRPRRIWRNASTFELVDSKYHKWTCLLGIKATYNFIFLPLTSLSSKMSSKRPWLGNSVYDSNWSQNYLSSSTKYRILLWIINILNNKTKRHTFFCNTTHIRFLWFHTPAHGFSHHLNSHYFISSIAHMFRCAFSHTSHSCCKFNSVFWKGNTNKQEFRMKT